MNVTKFEAAQIHFLISVLVTVAVVYNRDLKIRRRRRQRERQKRNRFGNQNNDFARASRFVYISLPSLHDYDAKMPNFTFCR